MVDYEGAAEFLEAFAGDWATEGLFLHTDQTLETDTPVALQMSFPGLHRPISVPGVVRWHRTGAAHECGMGIGIERDGPRRELTALIERIRVGDPDVVSQLVRVLVVEDNPHVAQLIRNGLHGSGRRSFGPHVAFNFREAANGRDALELLEVGTYDALIIDVYLPVLDGAAVIAQVRRDPRLAQIPIIAVSAGGDAAREEAMNAGANRFLPKPMRLRQIVDAMRELIDLD
jgi:uncharacterized protein (TIGR02266 family)